MLGKDREDIVSAQTLSTAIRGDADVYYSGSEGVSILLGVGRLSTLRLSKKEAQTI
jgi:hypothetical protein